MEHWNAASCRAEILRAHCVRSNASINVIYPQWLVRFGVPGAILLGPLAIPPQLTSAILVAGGTPRGRVLRWQAVAIVAWTTFATVSVWLALQVVVQG